MSTPHLRNCPRVNCNQKSVCYPFRKYDIPAVMGDDSEGSPSAPENGAYQNALVEYKANGAMYVYFSDGTFTKLPILPGGTDVATVQYVDAEVGEESQLRSEADNAILAAIPTSTSQLANDSGFITAEHDPVFESSPAHAIAATDITNWNNKSDFSGSYNDLTDTPTIPAAQVQSDWNETDSSSKAFILNKPVIPPGAVIDSQIDVTSENAVQNKVIAQALSGKQDALSASQLAAVDSGITAAKVASYDGYATTIAGKADASSLAAVATSGAYSDLSGTPTIPAAQVNSDWNAASGVAQILNKPTLATVATSGSYNDLSNKPTIPAAQVNSDWNASSGKAQILNKPTLATVATSGSYNDLTNKPTIPSGQIQSDWAQTDTSEVDYIKNKPTIPTVNNATLTITQNGTSVGTFTANASSNKTIAVTDTTYSDATTSASGLMSASDKTKLNGIAAGAEANVQSDWNQTTTTADDYIKNKPTLATVATSGNYADLSGTPSVPTFTLQSTDPGEGGALAANTFIGVYQ